MASRMYESVICFGGEDWWYHNRAHVDMQLMRRFAKKSVTLYVNSIVMQKPKFSKHSKFFEKFVRKSRSIFKGLKRTNAGFWVYSPFSLPVHHLAWARPLNKKILEYQIYFVARKLGIQNPIVWVACPVACNSAMRLRRNKLVYQRTDRYEEFPNVDTEMIKKYDRQLKANADLTIFVSSDLYNEEARQCKKAIHLDHGVDFELFASAKQDTDIPSDIAGIKKPIVGFFGDIADYTVDINFVEKVADLLPHTSLVFVGKVETDCAAWHAKRNIWLIGPKQYEQIPHYGKYFDVAIMPWRQNRWIDGCNPIKLKEYLALGKPIVSTPFAELQKYQDVVYMARTPAQFAQQIELALSEDCPELVASRQKMIKTASWESKAELVMKELFEQIPLS